MSSIWIARDEDGALTLFTKEPQCDGDGDFFITPSDISKEEPLACQLLTEIHPGEFREFRAVEVSNVD